MRARIEDVVDLSIWQCRNCLFFRSSKFLDLYVAAKQSYYIISHCVSWIHTITCLILRNQLIPVPCIVSITLGTQRDGTRDNVHLPITGQLTCSPVDLHMSGQLTISWPRWTSYIWYLLLSLRRPRQSDIARARARIHFGNAGFARDLFASSAEEKAWRRSRGSIRNVGSAKLVGFSSHRLPIHQPSVTSASTNANSCPSSCSDSSHSFVHSFGRALVH